MLLPIGSCHTLNSYIHTQMGRGDRRTPRRHKIAPSKKKLKKNKQTRSKQNPPPKKKTTTTEKHAHKNKKAGSALLGEGHTTWLVRCVTPCFLSLFRHQLIICASLRPYFTGSSAPYACRRRTTALFPTIVIPHL